MNVRPLFTFGFAALLLAALACDKAPPSAPNGTILTVTANPNQISLTGTSTITVVGRRPDTRPLSTGVEIRFSTNLGRVEPNITTIRDGGIATTTFIADGRKGTATITATLTTESAPTTPPPSTDTSDTSTPSAGSTSSTTSVIVGADSGSRPTLLVSANPSNIPVQGTSSITIIARNSDNTPVSGGQTIVLTSNLGTLSPVRPVTRTDGTATSVLTAGLVGGTATIGAILGTSDQATTTVTIRDAAVALGLTVTPSHIGPSGGDVTLQANVVNGQGVGVSGAQVVFSTEAGTFDPSSGTVFTDSNGAAVIKLTLTAAQLAGRTKVTVGAKTFSGTGVELSQSFDIAIP